MLVTYGLLDEGKTQCYDTSAIVRFEYRVSCRVAFEAKKVLL